MPDFGKSRAWYLTYNVTIFKRLTKIRGILCPLVKCQFLKSYTIK